MESSKRWQIMANSMLMYGFKWKPEVFDLIICDKFVESALNYDENKIMLCTNVIRNKKVMQDVITRSFIKLYDKERSENYDKDSCI